MAAQPAPALLPAYLALGSDELKKRRVVERMDARLAASGGDPAFNREEVEGSSAPDPVLMRSMLDTLPFGGDFRLVVVHDVDKAPKAFTEALVSYLGDPNPEAVLLMTATKLAKSTRLYKAVAKLGDKAIMDCAPKKRWELPPYVVGLARTHGKVMDEAAAELLVRLVGESTLMLNNELGKLAVALGGAPQITEADVARLVPRTAEVKPWDFLDAVSRRDPAEALQLLALMPSQDEVGLFFLTVGRLRELVAANALAERGCPNRLADELGLQAWQVKNHAQWARRYTLAELVGALRSAADVEARLKSAPGKDVVFQAWVLSFCTPA